MVRRVVAEVALVVLDLGQDHRGLVAGIRHDRTQRGFHRAQGHRDAVVLVFVVAFQVLDGLNATHQRHAAAGNHTFFHRRAGRMQCVLDACLLLLHLDFGASTDLDHGHAAGELGNALLQFFTVVVGGRFLDLHADLLDARFDVLLVARTVDDRGVVLVHGHALGRAQVLERGVLELESHFLAHHGAAGQDREILQHGLAAVAEARRLARCHLDDAAHVVHDQRRQRLTFHVLGNHYQRLARLGHLLEQRQHVADVGDLLVDQQDEGALLLYDHLLLVVDEVGRQVAAVELHAFHHVELVGQALAFLDRDHAFLADLLHRLGDDLPDAVVTVGRDRADLGDRLGVGAGGGQLLELGDGGGGGLVDAALEVHRVHAGGNRLQAFVDDGLCQHGGGRGAVARGVGGLGSHFLHHLRAHVLELVLQLDFLGHRYAVLGDGRGTEGFVDDHVATARAQRGLHGVSQQVHALQHSLARGIAKLHVFSCHGSFL